jgi:TonB family protein
VGHPKFITGTESLMWATRPNSICDFERCRRELSEREQSGGYMTNRFLLSPFLAVLLVAFSVPSCISQESIDANRLCGSEILMNLQDRVSVGRIEEVKAILDQYPNLITCPTRDWSLVHNAIYRAHETDGPADTLVLLLERGANANERDQSGTDPLNLAVLFKRRDLAEALLSHGAEINKASPSVDRQGAPDGRTPLHTAALVGSIELTEMLLDRGANPNAVDNKGMTPLDWAVSEGYPEVAALLRKHGGRAKGKGGVEEAIENGDVQAVIAAFRRDPSLPCPSVYDYRSTLLSLAVKSGVEAVLDLFEHARCFSNIDIPGSIAQKHDDRGLTPMHWAVIGGNSRIVEILLAIRHAEGLKRGGNKDLWTEQEIQENRIVIPDNYRTPLHYAVLWHRTEIAKILIDEGYGVNDEDQGGETPLLLATSLGYKDIVDLLLANGADFYLEDHWHNTPYSEAKIHLPDEVARIQAEHPQRTLPDLRPVVPKVTLTPEQAQGLALSQPAPEYPPAARAARVSGTVEIETTLGPDGHVANSRVISGPPLLQAAALDGVKNWTYKPYIVDNQAAEIKTTIRVLFSLGKTPHAIP